MALMAVLWGCEKKPVLVETVSLSETTLTLVEGETKVLKAEIAPANAEDQSVTWSTSDKSVVTVEDGTVTAIKAGEATVTATANDKGGAKAECKVTVWEKDAIVGYWQILSEKKETFVNNKWEINSVSIHELFFFSKDPVDGEIGWDKMYYKTNQGNKIKIVPTGTGIDPFTVSEVKIKESELYRTIDIKEGVRLRLEMSFAL